MQQSMITQTIKCPKTDRTSENSCPVQLPELEQKVGQRPYTRSEKAFEVTPAAVRCVA